MVLIYKKKAFMLYGIEFWAKKQHVDKWVLLKMWRWINGNTKKDRFWNEEIHLNIGVISINEKMRKMCLRWFGHV